MLSAASHNANKVGPELPAVKRPGHDRDRDKGHPPRKEYHQPKSKQPVSRTFKFARVLYSWPVVYIIPLLMNVFASVSFMSEGIESPGPVVFSWLVWVANLVMYHFWIEHELFCSIYPLQSLSILRVRKNAIKEMTQRTGHLDHFFEDVGGKELQRYQENLGARRSDCYQFQNHWENFKTDMERQGYVSIPRDQRHDHFPDGDTYYTNLLLGLMKVRWSGDGITLVSLSDEAQQFLMEIKDEFEIHNSRQLEEQALVTLAHQEIGILQDCFHSAGLTLEEARQLIALKDVFNEHMTKKAPYRDNVEMEIDLQSIYDYTYKYRRWLGTSIFASAFFCFLPYIQHWGDLFDQEKLLGSAVFFSWVASSISVSAWIAVGVSLNSLLETGIGPWKLLNTFTDEQKQVIRASRADADKTDGHLKNLEKSKWAKIHNVKLKRGDGLDEAKRRNEVELKDNVKMFKTKKEAVTEFLKKLEQIFAIWLQNYNGAMDEMRKLSTACSRSLCTWMGLAVCLNLYYLVYIFSVEEGEASEFINAMMPLVLCINILMILISYRISKISHAIDIQEISVRELNKEARLMMRYMMDVGPPGAVELSKLVPDIQLQLDSFKQLSEHVEGDVSCRHNGFRIYDYKVPPDAHVKMTALVVIGIPLWLPRVAILLREEEGTGLDWLGANNVTAPSIVPLL